MEMMVIKMMEMEVIGDNDDGDDDGDDDGVGDRNLGEIYPELPRRDDP